MIPNSTLFTTTDGRTAYNTFGGQYASDTKKIY